MSAAWELPLATTPKMVLLALCDWANDRGKCFPSIPRIAHKASLSERQCQRVLQGLAQDGWVEVIANPMGGRSSKRYQINVHKVLLSPDDTATEIETNDANMGDDKLSPLTPMSPRGVTSTSPLGCHPCHPNRHRTINETTTTTAAPESDAQTLIFPDALAPEAVVVATDLVSEFSADVAQKLLDELAGAMSRPGAIKTAPVAYLRGIASKAAQGKFCPDSGLLIAQARERRAAQEKAKAIERTAQRQRREASNSEGARRARQTFLTEIGKTLGIKTEAP
jgi:hypothetical protein